MSGFTPYQIVVTDEQVAAGIEAWAAGLENWELSDPYPTPVSYDLPVRYLTPTPEARIARMKKFYSQHPDERGPRPPIEFK